MCFYLHFFRLISNKSKLKFYQVFTFLKYIFLIGEKPSRLNENMYIAVWMGWNDHETVHRYDQKKTIIINKKLV